MPLVKQEKPNTQTQNRFHVLGTIPSNNPNQLLPKLPFQVKYNSMWLRPMSWRYKFWETRTFKKFPHGKFFLQNNSEKTHKFYEFIPVDTYYIDILHIKNNTSIDICYSKCKLCKVLSQKCAVSLLTLIKCFLKTSGQSHMIIMIILTLGTILFSFVSSITLGFSIRVMKSKIKMIFQIGSKNGGYFLEPLRIFSILKFLKVTNTSLNMGVTWFLTSCLQVLFFLSRFQIP